MMKATSLVCVKQKRRDGEMRMMKTSRTLSDYCAVAVTVLAYQVMKIADIVVLGSVCVSHLLNKFIGDDGTSRNHFALSLITSLRGRDRRRFAFSPPEASTGAGGPATSINDFENVRINQCVVLFFFFSFPFLSGQTNDSNDVDGKR